MTVATVDAGHCDHDERTGKKFDVHAVLLMNVRVEREDEICLPAGPPSIGELANSVPVTLDSVQEECPRPSVDRPVRMPVAGTMFQSHVA